MIYASSSANKCKYIHVQSIIIIIVTWTSLNSVMIETWFSTKNTKFKRFFFTFLSKPRLRLEKGASNHKGNSRFICKLASCFNGPWNYDDVLIGMTKAWYEIWPTLYRGSFQLQQSGDQQTSSETPNTALLSCVNKNDTDLARTMTQLPQEQKTVLYWSKKM